MKRAVIDGDYYLYAAGFATEGEPVSHSCHALRRMMTEFLEELGISEYQIYISGKGNFRDDVAMSQGYKANRSRDKPTNYGEMRDFLKQHMGAVEVDGMEADDRVSMLLWEDWVQAGGDKHKCEVVCCSVDKDLNNTPGWHYQSNKRRLFFLNDRQSLRHFWLQMLSGDKVDNIKGLPDGTDWIRNEFGLRKYPGFGDASAKKVLAKSETAEQAEIDVITCYISWGDYEGLDKESIKEYIIENGTLLWMVRDKDELGDPNLFELNEELYDRLYERYTTNTYSSVLPMREEGVNHGGGAEGSGSGTEGSLRGGDVDSSGAADAGEPDGYSHGDQSGYDDYDGELRVGGSAASGRDGTGSYP